MNNNLKFDSSIKTDVIPIFRIIKWTYLPYLAVQLLIFLDTVRQYPEDLLFALKTFVNYSGLGYLMLFGPFILILVIISYFFDQTNIDKIPKNTTLYETITKQNINYGPIKIIIPSFKSENSETETISEN
ncbi:MAG: hypothetical protein ACXAB2_12450 [Candidatus Hodarchaeales archaeon]|jgi:hypothetical protein